MNKLLFALSLALLTSMCSTSQQVDSKKSSPETAKTSKLSAELNKKHDVAYFASGCFWCVEEVFESVIGVKEVISGYSGGSAADANYGDVSAGRTNHAEAVEVFYDKNENSFEQLLTVFFDSQDPTTKNQQGPDRGRQYRSAIFYQNETEKKSSMAYIKKLDNSNVFNNPIVTEVVPFEAFYAAEDYHQDYVVRNPSNGYVRGVSQPRFNKFKKKHPELLKKNQH